MRSIRLALAMGLVCSVLASAGCGDDGGDDDDDDDTIDAGGEVDAAVDAPLAAPTLDDICAADGLFADLFGQFVECNPLLTIFLGGTPTDADFSAACYGQFQDYVDDGTVTLGDGATMAACIAYVEGLTCADLEVLDAGPCQDLFVGTVALDGDCDQDEQCIGDAYCAADVKGGGCGTCVAQLEDGETCTEDAQCVTGRCRNDETCGGLSGVGDPCGGDDDCLGTAYCSDATGECTATVGDGADCADPVECGFPLSGLYCDPDTATCAAQSEVGEDCNDPLACDLFNYETCDLADTGQCLAPTTVNLGETCGLLNGAPCAAGLQCSNPISDGECFTPGDLDEACDPEDPTAACGFLLECIEGTCQYSEYSGICPAAE